jgi:hypothetical protein
VKGLGDLAYSSVAETSSKIDESEQNILKIIEKLKLFEKDIDPILKGYKDSISVSKVKDLRPMILTSRKTIVLPSELLKFQEEPVYLLILLAQKLGYEIREYESSKDYKHILTEEGKLFVRGMLLAVYDDEQIINIQKKSGRLSEGMAFARAAQTLGLFSHQGRDKYLVRNHHYFSNNPGEKRMVAKKEIDVIPLKDTLPSLFKADNNYLSNILYTLLKKSYTILSKTVIDDLKKKYTIAYSDYVYLYETQSFVVASRGKGRRRNQQETVSRVPTKPKSRSLTLQQEFDFLIKLHEDIFRNESYMQSKDAFVNLIWSDAGRNLASDISKNIADKSQFLQKFAQLTTRRLQEFRKTLKKPDLRKADFSIQDIEQSLRGRGAVHREFINELIRMNTSESKRFIQDSLELTTGFEINTLDQSQYVKLSNKLRSCLGSVEPYKSDSKSFELDLKSRAEFPKIPSDKGGVPGLILKTFGISSKGDAELFIKNFEDKLKNEPTSESKKVLKDEYEPILEAIAVSFGPLS